MIAEDAHCLLRQSEAATGDDETTIPEAHGDGRMIAEALDETAHAIGPLAARLDGTAIEETEIDTAVIEENDLQVLQKRIAEDTGTAAADTVTTVNATANDLQEDTEALDDHVLHDERVAPRHYSEADRFPHNRTHSQTK